MNPKRWQEIVALYGRALEVPEAERKAWLARECADDQELAKEVVRLLSAKVPVEFIEPPTPAGIGQMPTELEKRQLGDFELLNEIGRGGMGIVFRAWQRSVGRMVAVKVLPPSLVLSEHKVQRFEREARAVGKLQHPGIAAVHAVGFEQGVHYFAMDLVEGQNLAAEMEALRARVRGSDSANSRLPDSRDLNFTQTVARLMREAADALSFAHQHGIVHRDVKPANLLLDRDGKIKLVDFGLARDEALGSITRTGELAGTPHYMSPEQARAKRHSVDHRTDIYSLGVVMFELLTLKRPFEGRSSHEIVSAILFKEPLKVRAVNPKIPRDLELICQTAMAKEPKERYQDAGALRDDLDRFLAHQSILAQAPSLGGRTWRWTQRHQGALRAAGIAALALSGGITWQSALARSKQMAPHLQAIARGVGAVTLEDLPPGEQFELRDHLAAVVNQRGRLDSEQASQVDLLRARFEHLREFLTERGKSALALSRDPTQPEGARESSRLAAVQTLQHASLLFPLDSELKRLASIESAYPHLSLAALDQAGQPIDAQVFVRSVEPLTCSLGARVPLGRAPLQRIPLLPGDYIIVVEFDQGGSRELICRAGAQAADLELAAVRRADEDEISRDMLLIPAGQFSLEGFGGEYQFPSTPVELEAFWIDKSEVSVQGYARFLSATGRARPIFWESIGDLDEFLRLHGQKPVAGVSWREAMAYAEWAGKRLPTLPEWLCAAGGRDQRPWPYSNLPDEAPRGNVLQPIVAAITPDQIWNNYLQSKADVDAFPEARTPEGAFHFYGNVAEWTGSMAITLDETNRAVHRPLERWVLGGQWDVATCRWPLRFPIIWGIGPKDARLDIGFRCAKSATPP